jgi:hypothetical protein
VKHAGKGPDAFSRATTQPRVVDPKENPMLIRSLAASALTLVFLASHIPTADAYTRSGSATGAKGRTVSSAGSGSYTRGSGFKSSGSYTGPRGQSVNRNSGTSCSGGACSRGSTWTR